MGNFYPPTKMANGISRSRPPHGEDDLDAGLDNASLDNVDHDTDVVSLLEENARLRVLVTQLSGLVLKHVVNEK
jgi:hypothetical protein